MGVLKYAALGVAGVVAVTVAVAAGTLSYVQSSDLGGWARWAAAKNGVTLETGGPVRVTLFPYLEIKVEKFGVKDLAGGDGMLAHVDEARIRMAWGRGLTPWKGFVVQEVEAKNPTIALHRLKDGSANWELPVLDGDLAAKPAAAKSSSAGGMNLPMLAATKLSVANLNLTYDDQPAARKVVVKGMDVLADTEGLVATTRLQGTVNDQAVSGNLRVDMGNFENIPVNAKLDGAGLTLAVQGTIAAQKEFAGQVNVRTANLRSTLAALLGKAPAQAPADVFQLTGDMTGGADRVVLRNFNTSLGDLLKASGDIDVSLGGKPSAKGQLRVQGGNLRQLAELGTGSSQPALPASSFSLSTDLAGQDEIVLKKLVFTLGNLATLNGEVSVVPQPLKLDATMSLNAASLRALAQAFGQAGNYPALPLNARMVLNGRGNTYTLKSFDAALADLAKVGGNATVTLAAQPEVEGKFALEGDNILATAKAFGIAAGAIPASPFKAGASVRGKGTLTVDDLSINLPQLLEATGKLAYTPGKPANLNGRVDVARLDATALGVCSKSAPVNTAAPTAAAAVPAAGASPWTSSPLDLTALQAFAMDIALDVKGLSCENFPASAASARIINTPSQLDVKDLNVVLPQNGSIGLSAVLRHAGTPALTLTLNAANVPVQELVPTLKAKGIELPLNAKADLSSSGASTRALAGNLAGTLQLSADKGRAPYTNLLGNINVIQNLLKGQASVPANGNGLIDSFKASYILKDGVATAESFDLSTDNGSMVLTSSGTIDIGNWLINTTLTPKVTASDNAIEVPVLVKGPLTAPSIGADPSFVSKLTGRLAAEGLKSALGLDKGSAKGVGGVVGDMFSGKGVTKEGVGGLIEAFGKKGKSTTDEASATQPSQPTQQQQLQNILNGVLNK